MIHYDKYGKLLKGLEDDPMLDNSEIVGNNRNVEDVNEVRNVEDVEDVGNIKDIGDARNAEDIWNIKDVGKEGQLNHLGSI